MGESKWVQYFPLCQETKRSSEGKDDGSDYIDMNVVDTDVSGQAGYSGQLRCGRGRSM